MANSLLRKRDREIEEDPMAMIGDRDPEEVLKKINTRKGFVEVLLGNQKDDEYNPAQPNDFESLLNKRKRLKKELEKKIKNLKEAQALIKLQESQKSQVPSESLHNMSAEEALQARLRKSQKLSDPSTIVPSSGESKAKRWLESMGWKGKGLGKQEQGILNPLIVRKNDAASGVIQESQLTTLQPGQEQRTTPKLSSRVVVLEDFVEVADADDELRDEVKFECERFGEVKNCVVHIQSGSEKDRSQVRVFIEFAEQEAANAAYLDFSTRFFNERPILPDFYDEAAFQKQKFKESSLNATASS